MRQRSRTGEVRAAVFAAALTFLLAGCSDGGSGDVPDGVATEGPVRFIGDQRFVQTAGVHADADEEVVFGATAVRNHGDTPATLTAGALAGGPGAGATVSQIRVVDISAGQNDLVGAAVWPFEDYERRSVPLEGFTLPPGGEAELLFIVSVNKQGTWYWPKTTLQYRSEVKHYQADTNFGFMICPRRAQNCDPPA